MSSNAPATSPPAAARPRASGALGRRLKTIPAVVLLCVLVVGLLPALLALGALVDVARWAARRTPWMATRLTAFAACYLLAEVVGLACLFGLWLGAGFGRGRARLERGAFAIQQRWIRVNLACVRAIFGLRFTVEGDAALAPAPFLLFVRHASMVDTLLPSRFVSVEHDIVLRFVLKKELLVDPCLDVAGNWLRNYFVDRASANTQRELDGIAALATDLGPRDAVIIYPEGTRFTEKKRARALAALAERAPELVPRAERLERSLPPRLGGPLTLLDAAPGLDVVVMAHHGFEGFGSLGAIWRGAMVRREIRVAFWREPRAAIPEDRDGRVAWLYDQWQRVDAWVVAASAR
ncbi:MAG: 1-acyl-sn-glycerol-3-phosphate acyltransferase [Myxococcales bacterium]|nr:1-acyl-sn-glycerol-3-phosphate acyltransferase [Myxococcales bacterium]MCB9732063.1 1-acyl-sn-glycerol-3-phosphate acyltransferase [Deltaproteobacteria bacterium]